MGELWRGATFWVNIIFWENVFPGEVRSDVAQGRSKVGEAPVATSACPCKCPTWTSLICEIAVLAIPACRPGSRVSLHTSTLLAWDKATRTRSLRMRSDCDYWDDSAASRLVDSIHGPANPEGTAWRVRRFSFRPQPQGSVGTSGTWAQNVRWTRDRPASRT